MEYQGITLWLSFKVVIGVIIVTYVVIGPLSKAMENIDESKDK